MTGEPEERFRFDDPEILLDTMQIIVWDLDLPAIEKLILLRVVHFIEPGRAPFAKVGLPELARDLRASPIEASRAVSSLKAKGLLEVTDAFRLCGRDAMWLTPIFAGIKAASLLERQKARGATP